MGPSPGGGRALSTRVNPTSHQAEAEAEESPAAVCAGSQQPCVRGSACVEWVPREHGQATGSPWRSQSRAGDDSMVMGGPAACKGPWHCQVTQEPPKRLKAGGQEMPKVPGSWCVAQGSPDLGWSQPNNPS